jgi:hypothetical protein
MSAIERDAAALRKSHVDEFGDAAFEQMSISYAKLVAELWVVEGERSRGYARRALRSPRKMPKPRGDKHAV